MKIDPHGAACSLDLVGQINNSYIGFAHITLIVIQQGDAGCGGFLFTDMYQRAWRQSGFDGSLFSVSVGCHGFDVWVLCARSAPDRFIRFAGLASFRPIPNAQIETESRPLLNFAV